MRYFAGRTGCQDTYEKTMKGESGVFPCHIQKFGFINGVDNVNWPPYRDSKSYIYPELPRIIYPELPRIVFGHERGNFRSTRLALIEWLKRSQRKRYLARHSGVGPVCAVNLDFGFLNTCAT